MCATDKEIDREDRRRLSPPAKNSFIRGHSNALPSSIRGGSRVREFRSRGSLRGAAGNGRLYRERALPVQTASRNCMTDEGGPFGFGNQMLISSHTLLAEIVEEAGFPKGVVNVVKPTRPDSRILPGKSNLLLLLSP